MSGLDFPVEMLQEFTRNGEIPVEIEIRDDSSSSIQYIINQNFTEENFQKSLERVERRETNYYGKTDTWMYQSLFDYPIKDKKVLIVGSTYPWYEAIALYFGAKEVIVSEYSNRESFNDKVKYTKPWELKEDEYDVCFSISSVEHDGLGRCGDPINPNGDLKSMKELKTYLKKDGLLFLSVPIGKDMLFWNVHRVYGAVRFPLLIDGWEKVKQYGFSSNSFDNMVNNAKSTMYQPITVLRNTEQEL